MTALRLIYAANIVVAGWISITSLFFPRTAGYTIFSNSYTFSDAFRLVGALWFGIFVLSIAGMWYPRQLQVVLLFQLVYKATWLLAVALPALLSGQPFPKGMAVFFLAWVLALPFVIEWKSLFMP